MEFAGQVVMITGAAGNLGQAVARAFKAHGAQLALFDRQKGRLAQIFPEWRETPDVAFIAPIELTSPEAVEIGVQQALARFGCVDVVVNAAGGFTYGPALHETPIEVLEHMFDINVRATFLVCRAVIPAMLAQGGGRIINVGSRAALQGGANVTPYSIAKSGVLRLTESLAAELKDRGIHVNCILPGIIDTPQNRAAMPKADFSKWVAPDSLAEVILFLASPGARDIHGAAVPVFGRA